jgi:hypothetical protein
VDLLYNYYIKRKEMNKMIGTCRCCGKQKKVHPSYRNGADGSISKGPECDDCYWLDNSEYHKIRDERIPNIMKEDGTRREV